MKPRLISFVVIQMSLHAWCCHSAIADNRSSLLNRALYTDFSTCNPRCDGSDPAHASSISLVVTGLSPAAGGTTATFNIGSYSDLRTTNRWLEVLVGSTLITSANATGAPSNGKFFESDGTNTCSCCAPNNNASFSVSADFFNARLTGGQITVTFRVMPTSGVMVQCMNVGCGGCNNPAFGPVGQQIVTITWCPASTCDDGNPCTTESCVNGVCQHSNNTLLCNDGNSCTTGDQCANGVCSGTPMVCNDSNPCTTDFCSGGACQFVNNANSCNDGLFCNGPDTCSGGSCSVHGPAPCHRCFCNEAGDSCQACVTDANCTNPDPCTGIESCVSGFCSVTFIGEFNDCNQNCLEDLCDTPDCNGNAKPDVAACNDAGARIKLDGVNYPCEASLPRIRNNTLRFTFRCDLPSTIPSNALQIREALPSGAFGSTNLANGFTFSRDPANAKVLKIVENGTTLTNGKWYSIRNQDDWLLVQNLDIIYAVVYGDADNTLLNDFADQSFIFANLTGSASDQDRSDINADTFVDFADISDSFAFNGSNVPGEPSGHGSPSSLCPP